MSFSDRPIERLFTAGNVAIFEWRNEPGWPTTYVTPSVKNLLGYEPSQLIDGALPFGDLVHPDDLTCLTEAFDSILTSGSDRFVHEDYRVRHADGHWVWVHEETLIDRDETGAVRALVGHLTNVTAQQTVKAELLAKHERLRLVLEGARLGMWDWNPQTNEVVFDERWARLLGHELDEIQPSLAEWEDRVHPDDLEACYADIRAHMAGETDFYENVHRMRHRDGRWVYILDRGRIAERDAEGRPTRFTGTHTDITLQKEAELAAQEASRATSTFLARMSHEIRTPLNGVLGVVHLLAGTEMTASQREYLETIRESGESLRAIINDVLDVAKVEAGEMSLVLEPFDPARLLRSIVDLYRERALAKRLDYRLEIGDDVPPCLVGDRHRLRQVLSNLLSNALKFTDEGHVVVRASAARSPDGATLRISVVDTGPGIADTDGIWEAFRQADALVSRTHGGTGLGLAISQQLTDLMGGSLMVESEPGKGSTFTLELELPVAERAPRPAGVVQEGIELTRLRVLVAEDNRVNQVVIRGVLDQLGQDVTVVENGRRAVDACRDGAFDVVLMDIHMPEMGGIEASQHIRALDLDTRPMIVAISADAFAPTLDAYAEARFDDSIAKPFKLDDLTRVLESAGRRTLDDAA